MAEYSVVTQGGRFFEICGEWYFNTREGIEGPFDSQSEATKKLNVYLSVFGNLDLSGRRDNTGSAISGTKPGMLPAQMQWR